MTPVWCAVGGGGLAVGIGTLVLARENSGSSLGGGSVVAGATLLAAGWLAIGIGTVAWHRRRDSRFGGLLVATGFAWFVAEWNNPGVGSSVVFTTGLVLYATCPPLAAHAALSYPGGRTGEWVDRVVLGVAHAGTVLVLGLLPALVFDPADQGCAQCPSNLVSVASAPDLVDVLNRAGMYLGAAWAIALTVLMVWRLAVSSPAARLVRGPVLLPAATYLGLVAATYVHAIARGTLAIDALDHRLWIAQAAALSAVSIGVLLDRLRAGHARSMVAEIVVELGDSLHSGGLRDVLATALGDPTLQIAYPIDGGRHVDANGRPIALAIGPGRAETALVRDCRPMAVLLHRADLLGDPRRVVEVTTGARLALDNERLQAQVRAQLADLRASRARIIDAGDAERRRLERDLHDGAQQRLIALSIGLRLLRSRHSDSTPAVVARLDDADVQLQLAMTQLRELAHGIHPAILTDEGLAAAVESLAEDEGAPVRIRSMPNERLPPAIETAAYLVVADVARTGPVRVSAARGNGVLVVEIDARCAPEHLVDLQDRVGALDGRLDLEPTPDGGIHLRAEIPCA
jgi:signal transduction histidine kinase